MSTEGQRTEISTVGEFGLIRRISELVAIRVDDSNVHEHLIMGIGDDAAAYKCSPGKVQLLTTDALIEGVHFDLTYTSMQHLGWKAIAASLSDIAAMGGAARYVTITLALPQKTSVEMVEEFYRGAIFACRKYSCLIIGGDTTASLANMMVSVSLSGEADEQKIIYRKGAQVGDYLCVTGHLGGSIAGLKILQREKQRYAAAPAAESFQPDLEPYHEVIEKHLMPKPRLDISRILANDVHVHSMIDISDGLAADVHQLCAAGDVGAAIWEHNLPLLASTQKVASEFSESPTEYALYSGEEYELLFTIGESEFAKLERLTNDVTVIGKIRRKEDGIGYVREQGEEEPLRPAGWVHFPASG